MKRKNILSILLSIIIILAASFLIISIYSSYNNKPQWYIQDMNYSKLHKLATGKNQTIALIDSGISKFQDSIVSSKISVINDNPYDINGHGTIMTSIIKGNGKNLEGIAPDANLISIKILNKDGKITPDALKKALREAINSHVDIINLSIGGYKANSDITDLIHEAITKNIIVVASSGDYRDIQLMFPANLNGVVSVGALDSEKIVLENSSAPNLTVINAPGENIIGTDLNNTLISSSGTSQAAALISGYIALLLEFSKKKNISIDNQKIIENLTLIKEHKKNYVDFFIA